MWALYIVTVFSMLIAGSIGQLMASQTSMEVRHGEALADQMFAYGKELNTYLVANPGFTGSVADSSLNNGGFMKPMCVNATCWSNIVTATNAYIYQRSGATFPAPVSMKRLEAISAKSGFYGYKNSAGNLISPSLGTLETLPGSIPTNAIVIKVR